MVLDVDCWQPDPTHAEYSHFQNKRLCERWLDNLFMVLYEDLRIYTIWRTDMARAKASSEPNSSSSPSIGSSGSGGYNKSAEEWEILGELAERLHHPQEAIEAYQSCLRIRFSPKAMKAVVKMWEEDKKSENVLQGMIRLIAWQYRWYSEVTLILTTFKVQELIARPVFTSFTAYCTQAHRGGRGCQGPEYRAGYELTSADLGLNSQIRGTVRHVQE